MKNDNGQQLSLTQALDLLKSRQGKNFKTSDVNLAELERCIPRSKQDIGALKKGHSALKRGQLKNCQI